MFLSYLIPKDYTRTEPVSVSVLPKKEKDIIMDTLYFSSWFTRIYIRTTSSSSSTFTTTTTIEPVLLLLVASFSNPSIG